MATQEPYPATTMKLLSLDPGLQPVAGVSIGAWALGTQTGNVSDSNDAGEVFVQCAVAGFFSAADLDSQTFDLKPCAMQWFWIRPLTSPPRKPQVWQYC
jgi:hypothetical protein